ncbi:MAG: helix-turn-helix transcriptional regulator [bacterium]
MYEIRLAHRLVQEARQHAYLTQRELAERLNTSQSAIAKLEQGTTNPTVNTLARCAAAAGFELRIELVPLPTPDPVVARYKQDVDRTLLRANLGKTVDDRLRTLAEWQVASRELQRAARAVTRHK